MTTNFQWMPSLVQLNMLKGLGTNASATPWSTPTTTFSNLLEMLLTSVQSPSATTSQDNGLSETAYPASLLSSMTLPETGGVPGLGGAVSPSSPEQFLFGKLSEAAAPATHPPSIMAKTGYDSLIHDSAEKYGVDPKLIKSVIQHESGGNTLSTSTVGAQGLMQLMPATARSLGVTDSYDPAQNIDGGTKYLSQMLEQFDGNKPLAVAAYNAGPGNVQKYDGIPPFQETKAYVSSVMTTYNS